MRAVGRRAGSPVSVPGGSVQMRSLGLSLTLVMTMVARGLLLQSELLARRVQAEGLMRSAEASADWGPGSRAAIARWQYGGLQRRSLPVLRFAGRRAGRLDERSRRACRGMGHQRGRMGRVPHRETRPVRARVPRDGAAAAGTAVKTRFGARPLRIGSDMILRVLVERPPATVNAVTQVAAEHVAFADEYGRYSGQPLHELAAELVRKPIWHFWWD